MATGSSVTKTPSGTEEIVVQGDCSEDLRAFIMEMYSVPQENIKLVDGTKKKEQQG